MATTFVRLQQHVEGLGEQSTQGPTCAPKKVVSVHRQKLSQPERGCRAQHRLSLEPDTLTCFKVTYSRQGRSLRWELIDVAVYMVWTPSLCAYVPVLHPDLIALFCLGHRVMLQLPFECFRKILQILHVHDFHFGRRL